MTAVFADGWASASGAEFVRSFVAGPQTPHVSLLGYEITSVQPGEVELAWQVPDVLLNPAGIAHGGFLVALLDDAGGLAVASNYPRFVPQLTVQLHTDFLAPVLPGLTHRVLGRVVRSGRTTSLADAWIEDPDGRLLTRSSGTFQPNRRAVPRDRWEEAGIA